MMYVSTTFGRLGTRSPGSVHGGYFGAAGAVVAADTENAVGGEGVMGDPGIFDGMFRTLPDAGSVVCRRGP
jgi:hypothetical protein